MNIKIILMLLGCALIGSGCMTKIESATFNTTTTVTALNNRTAASSGAGKGQAWSDSDITGGGSLKADVDASPIP